MRTCDPEITYSRLEGAKMSSFGTTRLARCSSYTGCGRIATNATLWLDSIASKLSSAALVAGQARQLT